MKSTTLRSLIIFLTALVGIAPVNQGWAEPDSNKVKQFIDEVSDELKNSVDSFGDDLAAVQDYLDHYHWKGLIQDHASSGAIKLAHLQLNGHSRVVVVRPGERIEGIVQCNLDREKCSSLSLYRVVLGVKGQGPQTTIADELGIMAGESLERFTLIAPAQPGLYEIRFRLVEGLLRQTAFDAWQDEAGNEPDATTTIGVILVKS